MDPTVVTSVHLDAGRDALLALGGLGAGVFNGVAGGGTLLSFPLLLAMGFPALTANVTSTVGIWPGYLGGVAGFRREIVEQRARLRFLAPLSVIGAVVGALLLLTTPSTDFSRLAPWLVLVASILFAGQPILVRIFDWHGRGHRTHYALLFVGMLFAAVYGGYFGAAMGVVMLAVLGLALPDTVARTSGMRTILSVLVNGVAAIVFIIHATLVWQAAAMLAIGSLVGGYLGARLALRLPAPYLRLVVLGIGVATAVRLLV